MFLMYIFAMFQYIFCALNDSANFKYFIMKRHKNDPKQTKLYRHCNSEVKYYVQFTKCVTQLRKHIRSQQNR